MQRFNGGCQRCRGSSRNTWMQCVEDDMRLVKLCGDDAQEREMYVVTFRFGQQWYLKPEQFCGDPSHYSVLPSPRGDGGRGWLGEQCNECHKSVATSKFYE